MHGVHRLPAPPLHPLFGEGNRWPRASGATELEASLSSSDTEWATSISPFVRRRSSDDSFVVPPRLWQAGLTLDGDGNRR